MKTCLSVLLNYVFSKDLEALYGKDSYIIINHVKFCTVNKHYLIDCKLFMTDISLFEESRLDGLNFLIFKDGSRGNESLIGDYFLEIPSREDTFIDLNMVAPAPNILPRESNPPLTRVPNDFPQQGNFEATPQHVSAIAKLLNDSKKTKTTLKLTIIADIPPTELMKVLSESYDDGEKQVLDYLSANVDVSDVKNQIAKQIWEQVFTKKKLVRRNEAV
jgi:uncharacterized protein YeeX (DUF496 family)